MSFDFFDAVQSVGLHRPRGILQVGASYGQEFQQFVDRGVECGVLVEPLPAPYEHLAGLCRQRAGFVAFNALCTDVAGETHRFHVASNGGMSSSILAPKNHLQVFEQVRFDQTVELTSTTVDHIVAFLEQNGQGGVTQGLDTLYLDVQGAEFKVLLGAGRTLRRIDYIYTELIRSELYEGMMPLASYCSLLDAQGFVLNKLDYNARHHADALFVRKGLLGLT
jgi:FkbM family methyltransferase